jgi:hypothetical protein
MGNAGSGSWLPTASLTPLVGRKPSVGSLHAVTGSGFGYPTQPLATSWRAAFGGMLDTILAEAEQYRVALPLPADVIRQRAASHEKVLDEVTTPALVHFDLWDGNVLIDTLALYRTYPYLIMLVEAVPRGYDASRHEWLAQHVVPALVPELDLLGT